MDIATQLQRHAGSFFGLDKVVHTPMARRGSEIIRMVGKRRLSRDLDGREAWESRLLSCDVCDGYIKRWT